MPTETVYGLAADAENLAAVGRIFVAKGRPSDHPMIVHILGSEGLDLWATSIPAYARRLAEALWPGPMTLILPRTSRVADLVTGGQNTVGLRAPAHPMARELLEGFGGGLAAPSANRFGRVSPTTAQHVLDELGDQLVPGRDVVLDGGPCAVGIESVIIDCTRQAPVVLRPGAITAERIERIGRVRLTTTSPSGPDVDRPPAVRAPGTLASHYAPRTPVLLAADAQAAVALLAPLDGLLAPAEMATPDGIVRLAAPADVEAYARCLFTAFREADARGLRRIIAVPPRPIGIGVAVRDRLGRAAATRPTDPARALVGPAPGPRRVDPTLDQTRHSVATLRNAI
jgi:L-threonylcarbamoyladenylate synthase